MATTRPGWRSLLGWLVFSLFFQALAEPPVHHVLWGTWPNFGTFVGATLVGIVLMGGGLWGWRELAWWIVWWAERKGSGNG